VLCELIFEGQTIHAKDASGRPKCQPDGPNQIWGNTRPGDSSEVTCPDCLKKMGG